MPEEQRARFLTNIRTESARLQRLIDVLVALSVIENRKKLEEPHRIDLSALVDRVVRQIRERSATVTINHPAGQQAFVSGDEFSLENAVTNLLQNAIEFSPEAATVTVAVERQGKMVVVRILDEGPGIPAYAQNKIFDRFYS